MNTPRHQIAVNALYLKRRAVDNLYICLHEQDCLCPVHTHVICYGQPCWDLTRVKCSGRTTYFSRHYIGFVFLYAQLASLRTKGLPTMQLDTANLVCAVLFITCHHSSAKYSLFGYCAISTVCVLKLLMKTTSTAQ